MLARTVIVGLVYAFAFCASPAFADETDYVYLIRIPARPGRQPLVQTGFRLAGTRGIVTALHGVANGDTFSATNHVDAYHELKIIGVDIERDLALLGSRDLEVQEPVGLPASARSPLPGDRIETVGHPFGSGTVVRWDITVAPTPIRTLRSLLGTLVTDFERTKSPSVDMGVIVFEANVVPGESGAPALDRATRSVIGVINGGLRDGAGIAWATTLPPRWRNPAEVERLKGLPFASRHLFRTTVANASPLRLRISAGWFLSIDPRNTTTDLGSAQTGGFLAGAFLPLGRGYELGGEASIALREAVDSAVHPPTSERKYLRDSFYGLAFGRHFFVNDQWDVMPMFDIGIAQLQVTQVVYSRAPSPVGDVLHSETRTLQRQALFTAFGGDISVPILRDVQFVTAYRLYITPEAKNDFGGRGASQQRIAFGVRLLLHGE